jgi:DNA gyrase/topoisomerase IV subunit B
VEKALLARRAREEARKARAAVREQKKGSKVKNMLGKLTPAQGRDKFKNELFLVEGNSAGGSAKSGRDRKFQAILPLRGKVINAEKTKLIDLLKTKKLFPLSIQLEPELEPTSILMIRITGKLLLWPTPIPMGHIFKHYY